MFIAPNKKEFQSVFTDKLFKMLSSEELGTFILVLANSMQDEVTHAALKDELSRVFVKHKAAMEEGFLRAAPDDLEVFKKLVETGIDNYSVWQSVNKDYWLQFYNPLRALRPERGSAEKVSSITKAFHPDGFNFNKPFLKPEIFWQGMIGSKSGSIECNVLYNKFPFLPYHFLFVPEPGSCHAQYLTQRFHQLVWDVCANYRDELEGIGFGYNSVGACASVNHLHFQGFIYEEALPIEHESWKHNNGSEAYPMRCYVYKDAEQAWQFIELLHTSNQPYNILYRPGVCYVLLRKMQGSETVRERVAGAGWIEGVGVFSEAARESLVDLTVGDLSADIESLSA